MFCVVEIYSYFFKNFDISSVIQVKFFSGNSRMTSQKVCQGRFADCKYRLIHLLFRIFCFVFTISEMFIISDVPLNFNNKEYCSLCESGEYVKCSFAQLSKY